MGFGFDPSRPIYIHAINKLKNSRTEELFTAMEAECLPVFAEHGVHLHSCWESAPGQGMSPESVEIWELRDFATYEKFVAVSHGPAADPRIKAWKRTRDEWVGETDSMLCLPHPVSPTIAELRERGVKAKLILHEVIHTNPSMQADYLDGMVKMWWKIADAAGHTVLALIYSPWNNRRAIKIQGMGPEWDDLRPWTTDYGDHNEDFAMWMKMAPALRDDYNDRFLVPAPFSTAR
jgi:hypothetical protein